MPTSISWLFVINVAEWVIRLVMVPIILRRRFVPATALAWLVLIFFVPELGLILYTMFGTQFLGRKRRRRHRQIVSARRSPDWEALQKLHAIAPTQTPVVRQAQAIGGMPIVTGNDITFLPDVPNFIARLIADIDAARTHIHMLFYIYAPDEVGSQVSAALTRACKRGVRCRLLVDGVGAWPFTRSSMCADMCAAGIETHSILPVHALRRRLARIDLRNHRKLAVIDGQIAYTGSQNIVNSGYGGSAKGSGDWIDMSGRFTGPIVNQMQQVFADDWTFTTDQVLPPSEVYRATQRTGEVIAQCVPTGPSHESETFRRVVLAAINAAQSRLIITSPYLVPDEPTMVALSMAADRGVQVDMVVPRRTDHFLVLAAGRAYFEELLEARVNLYRYEPGVLHSKTMTADDSFALLGSANLDIRSYLLNFEMSVLMYGAEITRRLRTEQEKYISQSTKLTTAYWTRRQRLRRYLDSTIALMSPLL